MDFIHDERLTNDFILFRLTWLGPTRPLWLTCGNTACFRIDLIRGKINTASSITAPHFRCIYHYFILRYCAYVIDSNSFVFSCIDQFPILSLLLHAIFQVVYRAEYHTMFKSFSNCQKTNIAESVLYNAKFILNILLFE